MPLRWPFGRRVLRPQIWPAPAGTWRASRGGPGVGLPPVIPIQAFTSRVGVDIGPAGQAAAVVPASGSVTLRAGPAGVGDVWDLDSAGISTTTGAADASTCAIYAGPMAIQAFLVAQSYAGGGDAIGLAGIRLRPGEYVWAVWTGAKQGDTATLKVTGTDTALAAW